MRLWRTNWKPLFFLTKMDAKLQYYSLKGISKARWWRWWKSCQTNLSGTWSRLESRWKTGHLYIFLSYFSLFTCISYSIYILGVVPIFSEPEGLVYITYIIYILLVFFTNFIERKNKPVWVTFFLFSRAFPT